MIDPRPLVLQPGDVLSASAREGDEVYFEVTGALGSGGSGVVYESVSDEGVLAVVKGPRLIGGRDPALAREARVLQQLPPHPNLIRYLGLQQDPRGHHLVFMERAYPNPLRALNLDASRNRLDGQGESGGRFAALPPSTALELGFELIRALEFLHSHRIAHCDVKPENLLVRLDWNQSEISDKDYFDRLAKGQWRGVLIDLGGSRHLRELARATARVEDVELPSVTPIYAPPEVLPGFYDADAGRERSRFTGWMDVYAFGLTLYQFLTGHVPYQHLSAPPDPTRLEEVVAIKRDERDGAHLPISKAVVEGIDWSDCRLDGRFNAAQLSQRLWDLLARSVHYDPTKRGNAKRMRIDLAMLLGVKPLKPSGETNPLVAREWEQRRVTLLPFTNRLVSVSRDGTGKVDLKKIRRGGADFWEMEGFRPTP